MAGLEFVGKIGDASYGITVSGEVDELVAVLEKVAANPDLLRSMLAGEDRIELNREPVESLNQASPEPETESASDEEGVTGTDDEEGVTGTDDEDDAPALYQYDQTMEGKGATGSYERIPIRLSNQPHDGFYHPGETRMEVGDPWRVNPRHITYLDAEQRLHLIRMLQAAHEAHLRQENHDNGDTQFTYDPDEQPTGETVLDIAVPPCEYQTGEPYHALTITREGQDAIIRLSTQGGIRYSLTGRLSPFTRELVMEALAKLDPDQLDILGSNTMSHIEEIGDERVIVTTTLTRFDNA